MSRINSFRWAATVVVSMFASMVAHGDEFEQAPIHYSQSVPANVVSRLQDRMDAGEVKLNHESHFGYLRSVLKELQVPLSSQMLVFSKTSLQRERITPRTPRALYFNDDVYIGFCQNGEVMEVSTADPQLGGVFYTLSQTESDRPKFSRQGDNCLICHASSNTQQVPGHLIRSVYPDARGFPILASGTFRIDHSSPIERRWGGWYVTGTHGAQKHLGNFIADSRIQPENVDNAAGQNIIDLGGKFRVSDYLTESSDIVALMVMEHQAEGHNLLTRASYATRQAQHFEASLNEELRESATKRWDSTTARIRSACEPLVRYLLYSKEAALTAAIKGNTEFAREFAAKGIRDSQGRSLRDFDLEHRLFKYPCSYLIYTENFRKLPVEASEYVWRRIGEVLTGKDRTPEFQHLTESDRSAIAQILVETVPECPQTLRDHLASIARPSP